MTAGKHQISASGFSEASGSAELQVQRCREKRQAVLLEQEQPSFPLQQQVCS